MTSVEPFSGSTSCRGSSIPSAWRRCSAVMRGVVRVCLRWLSKVRFPPPPPGVFGAILVSVRRNRPVIDLGAHSVWRPSSSGLGRDLPPDTATSPPAKQKRASKNAVPIPASQTPPLRIGTRPTAIRDEPARLGCDRSSRWHPVLLSPSRPAAISSWSSSSVRCCRMGPPHVGVPITRPDHCD